MHNILIFEDSRSYLNMSFEKHMTELGYGVINVEDALSEMKGIKEKISAIVLFVDENLLKKLPSLTFLRTKATEEDIRFFIIADLNEMEEIRKLIPNNLIQKEFQRPVNVKDIESELDEYIKSYEKQEMKKVLVVDDSGAVLRSVKGWLEHKYQVILANSGTMAIKYLSTNRPDLVLLDYEMPILNGRQVLEMMRSEDEFKDIPVIFLTGKNDVETIRQVLELKLEGYILKSTKPEQIIKTIDDFFAKQKNK